MSGRNELDVLGFSCKYTNPGATLRVTDTGKVIPVSTAASVHTRVGSNPAWGVPENILN